VLSSTAQPGQRNDKLNSILKYNRSKLSEKEGIHMMAEMKKYKSYQGHLTVKLEGLWQRIRKEEEEEEQE
jgi:hypothetical protein